MCRFALYLGDEITVSSLVTEPVNSIIHQSFHSHERVEPLNGDGFGIAWYGDRNRQPAVFKEVRPAWNSFNLRSLAPVTRTHCLMAHVRAASPGLPVTQLNCHPFSWNRLSFMHNGNVGGFLQMKRRLQSELSDEAYLEIQGSTDSEHVFALIKEEWKRGEALEPLERLATALVAGIHRVEALRQELSIEEPTLLNLALSDGERAVVSRYVSSPEVPSNSLYVHRGSRYSCEDGVCRMLPENGRAGAVIVASEPLSEDQGWKPVPENHLVLLSSDLSVEMQALASAA